MDDKHKQPKKDWTEYWRNFVFEKSSRDIEPGITQTETKKKDELDEKHLHYNLLQSWDLLKTI